MLIYDLAQWTVLTSYFIKSTEGPVPKLFNLSTLLTSSEGKVEILHAEMTAWDPEENFTLLELLKLQKPIINVRLSSSSLWD